MLLLPPRHCSVNWIQMSILAGFVAVSIETRLYTAVSACLCTVRVLSVGLQRVLAWECLDPFAVDMSSHEIAGIITK